jgi:hypothetical protein
MTTNSAPETLPQTPTQLPTTQPAGVNMLNAVVDQIMGTLNKADQQAALQRVAALRARHPHATAAQLAERIIRQRCLQAGAVGAVTSSAAIIPGVGTMTTLVFGVAADLRLTYQIQSELVLELAAVYNRSLGLDDQRYIVALVTGLSAGSNQLVAKAGVELAEKATERLAHRAVTKSIPYLGVAASGGINLVATYLIGRRAQAYFSQDPLALVTLNDHVRTLTGVDERLLVSWLAGSTEQAWRLVSRQAQNTTGVVIVAGRSAGKLALAAAGQAGELAGTAWGRLKQGATSAAQAARKWRTRRHPANEPTDIPITPASEEDTLP